MCIRDRVYIAELTQFLKQPTTSKGEVKAFKVLLYLKSQISKIQYSSLSPSHLLETPSHSALLASFYQLYMNTFDKTYASSVPLPEDNANYTGGYITFHSVTFNSNERFKFNNNRLKVITRFYNKVTKTLLPGSSFVDAVRDADAWKFNKTSEVGTNPIAFKWTATGLAQAIDIMFELVLHTDNNKFFSLGYVPLPLTKSNTLFDHVLELTDSGNKVGKLFLGIRPVSYLSARKQKYLDALPGTCLVHKRLLSFCFAYSNYLLPKLDTLNKFETDVVLSEFMKMGSDAEVIQALVNYWSKVQYSFLLVIARNIRGTRKR
eukprot:TRINITY_DN17201_c0_g1_i2.p1 TRINITY_DN17201_c0_g1~~TRINITY_DN17201_c0_g1_i2.p1  ORF type:complete len:319 (-),score=2.31 TRINITY_DN17201_c0_g1_i2:326-1282(-)